MKKRNLIEIFELGLLTFLYGVSPVWAQTDSSAPPQLTQSVDGSPTIGGIVDSALKLLIPIAGIVCVAFVIMGGYMWLTSAGDPSKVKRAQGTLTWALIGLVFIIISAIIIYVITKFVIS